MTPQEHYAEAERLLREAVQCADDSADEIADGNETMVIRRYRAMVDTAQVHATLATVGHRTASDPNSGS